eukprot:15461799-Alexandrium_andersonii.AAC.1
MYLAACMTAQAARWAACPPLPLSAVRRLSRAGGGRSWLAASCATALHGLAVGRRFGRSRVPTRGRNRGRHYFPLLAVAAGCAQLA